MCQFQAKIYYQKYHYQKKIWTMACKIQSGETKQLDFYRYDYDPDNRLYFVVNIENTELATYLLVKKINNIWQEKNLFTEKKFRMAGLTKDFYFVIIKQELGKLISDAQLSDDAELFWNSLNKILTIKIYDKKLNKIYNYNEIGKITDDGEKIISPYEDETYSKGEYDDTVRFFLLAETIITENTDNRLKYYLKYGKPPSDPEPYMPRTPRIGKLGDF